MLKDKQKLKKEIKEMEKLAESFKRKNKYMMRKSWGMDAVNDLTNFVRDYDDKVAVLSYIEEKEEKKNA